MASREIVIAIANVKDENESLITHSRKFKLSEFIKKVELVDVPGKAICTLCDCLFCMVGGVLRLLLNTAKGRSMLRK